MLLADRLRRHRARFQTSSRADAHCSIGGGALLDRATTLAENVGFHDEFDDNARLVRAALDTAAHAEPQSGVLVAKASAAGDLVVAETGAGQADQARVAIQTLCSCNVVLM